MMVKKVSLDPLNVDAVVSQIYNPRTPLQERVSRLARSLAERFQFPASNQAYINTVNVAAGQMPRHVAELNILDARLHDHFARTSEARELIRRWENRRAAFRHEEDMHLAWQAALSEWLHERRLSKAMSHAELQKTLLQAASLERFLNSMESTQARLGVSLSPTEERIARDARGIKNPDRARFLRRWQEEAVSRAAEHDRWQLNTALGGQWDSTQNLLAGVTGALHYGLMQSPAAGTAPALGNQLVYLVNPLKNIMKKAG